MEFRKKKHEIMTFGGKAIQCLWSCYTLHTGHQTEDHLFMEQLLALQYGENQRKHLVFSGPSGIGKTRLLDRFISLAQQTDCR